MSTGEQTFSVGGTEYCLRLGWVAMDAYEDIAGESILVALEQLEDPQRDRRSFAGRMVKLFFAAVQPQPDSIKAAAVLMDDLGSAKAVQMISEAAAAAWKGMEASDEEKKDDQLYVTPPDPMDPEEESETKPRKQKAPSSSS